MISHENSQNLVSKINFKNILDSVYNGVVVCDAGGEIIIFNKAAARWTGIPREKALGERIDKILPDVSFLEVLKTKESKTLQKVVVDNKLLVSNRFPIYDDEGDLIGATGIFQDISEFKKVSQELKTERQLKKELQDIIESSYDGIWITDGEGYTLYINTSYERISGIKKEEVLGKHMQELVEQGYFSESVSLHVLKKKERVTIMHDIYTTGKRVLITGNPIFDQQGKITRVVTNVRDITELINLKQELEVRDKLTVRYETELAHLRSQQMCLDNVVMQSRQMSQVFDLALRVGKVDSTVLILGESGVGKELVAQTIVHSSERKDDPFIKVNCGAIPENLLESELFGYEKGAFTGADRQGKVGMFELAQKGTLFLDEVAEIPLNLQVKLLRVLQEQEVMRIGGSKPVKLDVRIITATNRNIEEMVARREFRDDLFYRLNVVPITVPPLRQRPDDIPAFINYFLQQFNGKYKMSKTIAPEVLAALTSYAWPGNVRELQNLIERLVVLTLSPVISLSDLPVKFCQCAGGEKPSVEVRGILPLKEAVYLLEKELLNRAMQQYGTTRRVAAVLGIDQSTVVRKLRKIKTMPAE